jgi:hypothetical protein
MDQTSSSTEDSTGTRVVTGNFEVTGWDDTLYFGADDPDGTQLARVTVRKTFTGAVSGSSVTELLTAGGGTGRGYVASELFEGSIEGRKGTIVFQHGGVGDASGGEAFGNIVPGTGTEELAGLRGTVVYRHDEAGAVVTLGLRS